MTTSNHFKDNAASADTSELTRLDNQLCFAFYSVSNALTRMYGPVLAPLELTYPQYLVMLVLWERAPRGMGELSSQLGMDFGTLSPLVKRLEKSGRVTRTRDPEDERRVIVGLTKAGEALREQAAGIPLEMSCQIGLPQDEIVAVRDAVKRFLGAISQEQR